MGQPEQKVKIILSAEDGKTQEWFFFTLTTIWNEIGPSFRGNKKMSVIAVRTNSTAELGLRYLALF